MLVVPAMSMSMLTSMVRHGEPLEQPPEVLEERDHQKHPADEHVVNFCFTVILQDRAFPHREELM